MNTARAFLLVAAASLMAASSSAAETPTNNVAGNWIVRADFGGFKVTLSCFFNTTEQAISGPCITIREPLMRTSGRLDDKTMRFKYITQYNGGGLTLNYNGRVQADGTVKGSVVHDLAKGVFQATPRSTIAVGQMTPWIVSVGFDALKYSVLCAFKLEGDKLTGPCAAIQGASTLQAAGRVEGANVSFYYDTEFQGRPIHVEYNGALQPDGTLKGTIKEGASGGTFTADRQ